MANYQFMLNFALPSNVSDPSDCLDALYEAGCDDAVIGVGRHGMIGLDFDRDADSAEAALRSAIQDVGKAIPGAVLVQVGPDLVGLTDMADILGFSRQNMRKYATGQSAAKAAFPPPTVMGEPSLWHLAEIVAWMTRNTGVRPSEEVFAISKATAEINLEIEGRRIRAIGSL